jgi:hypothetical protein
VAPDTFEASSIPSGLARRLPLTPPRLRYHLVLSWGPARCDFEISAPVLHGTYRSNALALLPKSRKSRHQDAQASAAVQFHPSCLATRIGLHRHVTSWTCNPCTSYIETRGFTPQIGPVSEAPLVPVATVGQPATSDRRGSAAHFLS